MTAKAGNSWRAFALPFGTSFQAMVCVPHKAEPYSLKRDGKPILFPREGAARRAAYEHIVDDILQRPIYAENLAPRLTEHEKLQHQVFGAAGVQPDHTAEQTFGVVFQKGRNGSSHEVKVERIGRRRRRRESK
jgi:hypothetical protein